MVEEFDLLMLGTLAGGYAHLAWRAPTLRWPALPRGLAVLLVLMVLVLLQALWRGVLDAGGWALDWYASYHDALNSVRLAKAPVWALLCVPLLRDALAQSPALACHRLGRGMVVGLAVVAVAALWERAAFPGFNDFSANYRTVALFWEMHVGGAAIDAYLALAAPFAVWALVSARRFWVWGCAAVLALLVAHASLTTFSRGVYLAVTVPVLMVGAWVGASKAGWRVPWPRVPMALTGRAAGWRRLAVLLLVLALGVEVVWVMGGGNFMTERLSQTERDFHNRYDHWQNGLGLLETPVDGWLGLGLGRLPAQYASQVPGGQVPGAVTRTQRGEVALHGPAASITPRGQYALTQQVGPLLGTGHLVTLRLHAPVTSDLVVALCERHLLYDGRCHRARLRVSAQPAGLWRTVTVPLSGPVFDAAPWYAPRLAVLALSVSSAGGLVELAQVSLRQAGGPDVLANGDFSNGLAHWFAAAQSYFVPWHIDNVYLERLLDQGVAGVLLSAWLTGLALWGLVLGGARQLPLAPYLSGAVLAVLTVGLVSNVLDGPRVAFLFDLLVLFSVLAATSATPVREGRLARLRPWA